MKKMPILALLLVMAVSLFAQAENKPEITQPSEALAALQLANNLARFGYATESASALIGAAEIMVQVQTQALAAQAERSGTGQAPAAEQEYNPATLLADGKRLAGNDRTLIAWADEVLRVMNTRTRGAVGGPRAGWDVIRNREDITFRIEFRANQLAEVLVVGDGSTILDIFIYDRNGNLVTRTDVYTSDAYIAWRPSYTGIYQVVVRNWGTRNNIFEIFTN